MGVTMPPTAAMHGSSAFFTLESEPRRISCLISSPTTKKKMAIRPSFTQPRSERAWPATEKGRGVLQSASQLRLVASMLVSESEMAVARRSATLPSPRSWDMLRG